MGFERRGPSVLARAIVDDTRRGRRVEAMAINARFTRLRSATWRREGSRTTKRRVTRMASASTDAMRRQMRAMRQQVDDDDQLSTLMRGLRGQNIDDRDFAEENVRMQLVEIDSSYDGDALPLVYDPDQIAAYWSKRPVAVMTRVLQLMSIAGGFFSSIIVDLITGNIEKNDVLRARQIREIVTSLGPAYIKLGQALSIRPDILSPAAMNELQQLCDKVPSYDNEIAMELLRQELGKDWREIYSELSPKPVAAASLGQVYKGKLRSTGEAVAVKVQRPYVLETVSVDLYVMRRIGFALRKVPQITTDVVGLLDEWATRFFEELDYVNEGKNGTKFAEQMAEDLPQIVVPKTYSEYTSRKVLTTSWLEGEKLSQSTADDVGDLVNIGVICYLKQLLDTGFFHADPHPGNLIRTPDGRLAILDFGLMTQVSNDIKYGMIEAISHLIHRDYEAIVQDFVTLEFIPEGVDLSPILPVLAKVFDQALEGGGAKNINFQELAADLAQITFDYPFRIPPYFALIIRAIGVLEGIALVGNPEFALVDEAYPYLAKRLLTDNSPRLRKALKYMVYGRGTVFDADRLIDLLEAFETFSANTESSNGLGKHKDKVESDRTSSNSPFRLPLPPFRFPTPPALPAPSPARAFLSTSNRASFAGTNSNAESREALKFIFSSEGEFFREFLVDEIVRGIDAVSRLQANSAAKTLGLENTYIPVLLPGAVKRALPVQPEVSEEDRLVVENVSKILAFLASGKNGQLDTASVVSELMPVLPELATELLPEVSSRLVSRTAARTIRDIYVRE